MLKKNMEINHKIPRSFTPKVENFNPFSKINLEHLVKNKQFLKLL